MNIVKTLVTHEFCKSMAEARRLVGTGGVKVNHEKVTDLEATLKHNDFITTKKAQRPVSAPIETVKVAHGQGEGVEMTAEEAVAYIAKGLARGYHNFVVTKPNVDLKVGADYTSDPENPTHCGRINITIPIVVDNAPS
ncbi:MAG: S4 domain-containing protein [Planctomycetota bacterium]|jgi:ribosomal protein S4